MAAHLDLPMVTLCAATSVNVEATLAAFDRSLEQIEVAACILFTDADCTPANPAIQIVPIAPLKTARAYSAFMLEKLVEHVRTSHCLVIQWDGYVLDAAEWRSDFLQFDYIGAPWPHFADGHDVGNGGFSLRSRKLLEACLDPSFQASHPEDVAIGRLNRSMLETRHGIRFADRTTAAQFAFERDTPAHPTFGFHGVFNLVDVLGPDAFWDVYRTLDDRSTAFTDRASINRALRQGRQSVRRRLQFAVDHLSDRVRG